MVSDFLNSNASFGDVPSVPSLLHSAETYKKSIVFNIPYGYIIMKRKRNS